MEKLDTKSEVINWIRYELRKQWYQIFCMEFQNNDLLDNFVSGQVFGTLKFYTISATVKIDFDSFRFNC